MKRISEILTFLRDSEFRLKKMGNTRGLEGFGWYGDVYWNGKKVGSAHDSADGGPVFISVTDEALTRLNELGADLHYKPQYEPAGCYLGEIANATFLRKRLYSKRNKVIMVVHPEHDEGQYIEYSRAPSEDALKLVKEKLKKKSPNSVVLNDLLNEIKI